MIEHALFPTLVCEFEYPEAAEFKAAFYQHIFDHMTPDGYSNEYTGHVNLHHDPAFNPLFTFASRCIEQYLDRLHIDRKLFDVSIVKTWMNITKDRPTPLHNHGDAHISFTYYINIPDEVKKPIRFYNHTYRHEPYPGSMKFNNTSNQWDWFNSYTWQFDPKEGQMFVFPATLPHDTVSNYDQEESGTKSIEELSKRRICLAADAVITYKNTTASPMGLQPVENWRKF